MATFPQNFIFHNGLGDLIIDNSGPLFVDNQLLLLNLVVTQADQTCQGLNSIKTDFQASFSNKKTIVQIQVIKVNAITQSYENFSPETDRAILKGTKLDLQYTLGIQIQNIKILNDGYVYIYTSGQVAISMCNFIGNDIRAFSQVVAVLQIHVISTKVVLNQNEFSNNIGIKGSATSIQQLNIGLEMMNCTFTNNMNTGQTGTLNLEVIAKIELKECTFLNNTAPIGGVFYAIQFQTLDVLQCQFEQNKGDKPGIALFGGFIAKVQNSKCFNQESSIDGACIFAFDVQDFYIKDSYFEHIKGLGEGGVSTHYYYGFSIVYKERKVYYENVSFKNITGNNAAGMLAYDITYAEYKHLYFENCTGVQGGGILNYLVQSSQFTNITFMNSKAYVGSAIQSSFGKIMKFKDINIIKNSAGALQGGIILIDHVGIIDNYIEIDNIKITDSYSFGGGISIQNTIGNKENPSIIKNSKFLNNNFDQNVGCIDFTLSTEFQIIDSQFEGNQGGSVIQVKNIQGFLFKDLVIQNGYGGIKLKSDATLIFLENLTIQNNKKNGGIYINQSINIYLIDTVINNNESDGDGGGLFIEKSEKISIKNCIFNKNKAFQGGGMFFRSNSNIVLFNLTLFENKAEANTGGLMIIDNKNGDIEHIVIQNNKASLDAGGISIKNSDHINFKLAYIISNTAYSQGGGLVIVKSNNITFQISEIKQNKVNSKGGGVYILQSKTVNFEEIVFKNNTSQSKNGGGAYVDECSQISLKNSELKYSFGNGFQIINSNSTLIENTQCKGNYGGNEGGCIYSQNSNDWVIFNTTVEDNYAYKQGGAFSFTKSNNVKVQDSYFSNNMAKDETLTSLDNVGKSYGGTIYLKLVDTFTLQNSNLNRGFAQNQGGGLYVIDSQQIFIDNCIFNNTQTLYNPRQSIYSKDQNYVFSQGGGIFWKQTKQQDGQMHSKSRRQIQQKVNVLNITSSTFLNCSSSSGGGLFLNKDSEIQSQILINNCQFGENQADIGPAIRFLGDINNYIQGDSQINAKFRYNQGLIEKDNVFYGYAANERKLDLTGNEYELCKENTYLEKGGQQICSKCVKNGICLGGYVFPYPQKEYWRPNQKQTNFYHCKKQPDLCLGQDKCKTGHQGLYCQECQLKEGYREDGVQCLYCKDDNTIIWETVGKAFVTLVIIVSTVKGVQDKVNLNIQRKILSIFHYPLLKDYLFSSIMKIFISHTQILTLTQNFSFNYPDSFTLSLEYFGNPAKIVSNSLSCLFKYNSLEDEYMIGIKSLLYGLLLCIIILGAYLLAIVVLTILKKISKSNSVAFMLSGIVVFFITLQPGIILNSSKALSCRNAGGISYSSFNSSVLCLDDTYKSVLFPINAFILFLFAVAAPILLIISLVKKKKDLHSNSITQRSLGIIYLENKKNKYYWEFITMYQKILLIIISNIFPDETYINSALFSLVILSYIFICIKKSPYQTQAMNQTAILSSGVQVFTILLGLIVNETKDGFAWIAQISQILIFAGNGIFLIQVVILLLPEKIIEMRPVLLKAAKKLKFLAIVEKQIEKEKKAKYQWAKIRQLVYNFENRFEHKEGSEYQYIKNVRIIFGIYKLKYCLRQLQKKEIEQPPLVMLKTGFKSVQNAQKEISYNSLQSIVEIPLSQENIENKLTSQIALIDSEKQLDQVNFKIADFQFEKQASNLENQYQHKAKRQSKTPKFVKQSTGWKAHGVVENQHAFKEQLANTYSLQEKTTKKFLLSKKYKIVEHQKKEMVQPCHRGYTVSYK